MSPLKRKRVLTRDSKEEIALADAVIKQARKFFKHRFDLIGIAGSKDGMKLNGFRH